MAGFALQNDEYMEELWKLEIVRIAEDYIIISGVYTDCALTV